MAYTRSQYETGQLLWLLTLSLRGQTYRYATETVRVPSGSESLQYSTGLSPVTYEDRLSAPGESLSEPAVQLDLLFATDAAEGLAALAAGDLDLGDATGELALWVRGQDFATREVILSGPLQAEGYGALGEPVALTLSGRPWRAAPLTWPPNSEIVSASTWPRLAMAAWSIDDTAKGEQYPEIIGAPGYSDPRSPADTFPGSPALIVERRETSNLNYDWTVLVGRGRLRCVGVSNSVIVRNLTVGSSAAFTPTLTTDLLGQPVTIVTVTNAALPVSDGDELWISFDFPRSAGRPSLYEVDASGIVGGAASRTMRQAGEVIEYLLQLSGSRLDSATLTELRAWLAGYRLDFWLNEPLDPVDLVLDDILPLLPVGLRVTPAGLAVQPWRFAARASETLTHFDAALEGARRLGAVTRSDPLEVVNALGIRYATSGASGKALGYRAALPSLRYTDSRRERHPYAAASANRYGERAGADLESELIVDPATAWAVIDWQIRWLSQTRETVRYLAPQGWQFLRPGDLLTVSDSEIGWSERIAMVPAVVRAEGPTTLEFVTLPDGIRDGR